MKLRTLNNSDVETVSGWLSEEENYQWLDFGMGVQKLKPQAIKILLGRNIHAFRVFSEEKESEPIGLVALSDINHHFKTAVLWYVLGNKNYSGKNYTTKAVSEMLTIGFSELDLLSVFAWAIEENLPSRRVLEKNGFRLIGKRRKCHMIDGKSVDRMHYDILREEHQPDEPSTTEAEMSELKRAIFLLLKEELDVEVEDGDTNLIEEGYLDSLRFIQLIAILEERFKMTISLEDIDFDSFTTVNNIEGFVKRVFPGVKI